MEEEVAGVSRSAEGWSLTYFVPNASLSSVRLQVAKPFPNNQSCLTFVRHNFLALCFASAYFLLSSSTLTVCSWVGGAENMPTSRSGSLILSTKLPGRRSEYCIFHLGISLPVFVGCCVHVRQHALTSLLYSAWVHCTESGHCAQSVIHAVKCISKISECI